MGWLIYGTGGHAKVVIDLLELLEEKIDYMFDDNFEGGLYEGHPTGKFTPGLFPMAKFIISIGNNHDRKKVAEKMASYNATSLVHPKSIISTRTEIGVGSLILANAVIQTDTRIGKYCLINISATVDHEVTIGDYVQVGPGAYIASNVEIGEGAYIGPGAIINRRVKIKPWTVIPAGKVILTQADLEE